jgi:hypothetical protein
MTRKLFDLAILFYFLATFVGCAVSRPEMLKETEGYSLPGGLDREPGKAMVYIVRPSSVGTLIRFNVYVDDVNKDSMEAGYNRGNQYFYFNIGPGKHKLFSVAENTADMELTFNADSIYFVRQDAQMGIVMARNSLAVVDSVEGRYYVKKASPGTSKRKSFP